MLRLIKREKLGFEIYTVVWSSSTLQGEVKVEGEFRTKDFWSVEFAMNYIGLRWSYIDLNTVKVEEAGK